jgi:hypothetical protein
MKRFLLFAFVLMIIHPAVLADEAQVTATVDRNQLGVGDVVNYTISIKSNDSGQIEEPDLGKVDGVEVINTSTGVETRSLFSGGKFLTEQSRNFNYMLAVTKKGKILIPPINVKVDGKVLKTQPITLVVNEARPGQPLARQRNQRAPPSDPFEQMDQMEEELFHQMLQRRFRPDLPQGHSQGQVNPEDAFFIQAETDKTKVYVGEQLTTNYYLYTRGQIRDIDTLKYPDLKGFWKEDLEMATRLNFEQVVVNGIVYQRALLVSYALFPIKAGTSTIDSYKAKCSVLTPSTFGFSRPYQFTKSSQDIKVEVMDVPATGRPANYTGAVGNFRVTAQFEPTTGVTNQPVTLRVRFEGRGNAKLIEMPKLDLPSGFEIYDQKSQAKFIKDGTSFKEFEVLIIPRQPGVFQIPPLSIAVFDPEARKFSIASSGPLSLSVTGSAAPAGEPPPLAANDKAPGPSRAAESLGNEPGVGPLATELGRDSVPAGQVGFTVLIYAAAFLFLGFQAWTRLRPKPKRMNLKLVLSRRSRQVRDLAAKKEWRRVGVEMTNTAYAILGQLSEHGGASQELKRLLENTPPSLRSELAEPIEKLLIQCEALSFAPEDVMGGMTEKTNMDKLIADFEKVMSRAIELAEI